MMEDEIYRRFGIETEEYNLLLSKYRLVDDELVQERIREVEEQLEPIQQRLLASIQGEQQ